MKIIAEFCQNHNGDMTIVKDMIKEVAKVGATHAKIQTMFADELTHRQRFDIGKESIKRPYDSEYSRLKSLELNWDEHETFIEECKNNNIIPLTTVFTRKSVPIVKKIGFKEIKVASYDCSSHQIIREIKGQFNHIYVSTGATLYDELEKTANILNGEEFSFLHCITIYPTPVKKLNLKKMKYLKKFTNEVGFSDHTCPEKNGVDASIVAIMLGASVIERHFTILPKNKTKDGSISVNKEELKKLVDISKMNKSEIEEYVDNNIHNWKEMIGISKPHITSEEICNMDYYRGRFASKINKEDVYNWEKKTIY